MLSAITALLAGATAWGPPGQAGGQFKPGWNGLARKPPMGWRSWNAFGNRISQDMMIDAANAIVAKNRTVVGKSGKASLCDVGYCSVGVDEGWEGCGQGVDHTQHDIHGIPTIDAAFPDTAAMVEQIHALGLTAGWYLNGCKCGERIEKKINYAGDVKSLRGFNFDGVKIDGCGHQRNQTLYAALMAASGKNYTIENCHWGDCTESDDSSCPTQEWCPFNWYRSSGDINSGTESWLANLQTTIKFQDWAKPLSQPGCWAYPDMLEVGRVVAPTNDTFMGWNRAHFGAWCITSSPLILGMELSDAKLDPVIDIITNPEAIAINQAWDGHPGMLVKTLVPPPVPYSPSGAIVPSNAAGDIDAQDPASIGGHAPADAESSGGANIRTGGPGQTALIKIGPGIIGAGDKLDTVTMQFRYSTGYTMPSAKIAPTLKVLVLDAATGTPLKTLFQSGPLGNYSFDRFTGYSPAVKISATGLDIPTDKAVTIAMEVTNNQRNLQIPIDDKANGFGIKITWAGKEAGAAAAAGVPPVARSGVGPVGRLAGLFGSGQLWAKKMPVGGAAALLINHSPDPLHYTLLMKDLNLTRASYHVRDVWTRMDKGTTDGAHPVVVPAYDSAFLMLTPGEDTSV